MDLSTLTAISPVDGRYRSKADNLAAYFSEYALIRYRVRVEVEYFIALSAFLPQLKELDTPEVKAGLRQLYTQFSEADALRVKEIEKVTNHDVKAVEYFIKEKTDHFLAEKYHEFIHFGLTSQDINNTSVPLSVKEALEEVYYPGLEEVIRTLRGYAEEWMEIPMLARTHGQPASPTRLGKEVMVYVYRLEQQLALLKATPISAKFGGATGNFNAHHVAYPDYDWRAFGNRFVGEVVGLQREQWTTESSKYDSLGALFDGLKRINTILIDLNRDFWQYISMEYFKQKIKAGEIGSSAMPHKVNPIDFENSEGNLGLANAVMGFMARKLAISRMQRDLTDSTTLRNMGVGFGYTLIAIRSTQKGLGKLELNVERLQDDLDHNWEVLAEPIQTVMRKVGMDHPYERLKELTRGRRVNAEIMRDFVQALPLPKADKARLLKLTPSTYVGLAEKLAKLA